MTTTVFRCLVGLWLVGCASGPHPAVVMASKDFDCPQASLTRHEIYPNKQRIEGCGKEAIYIKGCTSGSYGTSGTCDWVKARPTP